MLKIKLISLCPSSVTHVCIIIPRPIRNADVCCAFCLVNEDTGIRDCVACHWQLEMQYALFGLFLSASVPLVVLGVNLPENLVCDCLFEDLEPTLSSFIFMWDWNKTKRIVVLLLRCHPDSVRLYIRLLLAAPHMFMDKSSAFYSPLTLFLSLMCIWTSTAGCLFAIFRFLSLLRYSLFYNSPTFSINTTFYFSSAL